jgi:hypothetical protein
MMMMMMMMIGIGITAAPKTSSDVSNYSPPLCCYLPHLEQETLAFWNYMLWRYGWVIAGRNMFSSSANKG